MKRTFATLILIATMLANAGCASAIRELYPPPPAIQSACPSVYVVSNGWHAGLIVKRADVDSCLWPELGEIPSTEYVEIGWGNEGFYMASHITPGLVLQALVPSPSVLHVAGFSGNVEQIFAQADLVKIELSKPGLAKLCRYIHATYVHDDAGNPVRLGPGLYGESEFYRAHGKYYFPNTCNVWTATALRAAGCPITPAYASTAGNVVFQARQFPTSKSWSNAQAH